MVAGSSFQPGTMGRQYKITFVRLPARQAVASEVRVTALLAKDRGHVGPEAGVAGEHADGLLGGEVAHSRALSELG
jgi:hypothetical protein